MRILIVSSYFGSVIGGALNFIKNMTTELSLRGHSVVLLLDDRYKKLFSEKEFNIIWFSSINLTSYSPSLSFLKIISKIEVDIIHLHGFMSFQTDCGAIVGFLRNIPVILTPYGSLLGYEHLHSSFFSKIPYHIHNIITFKLATRLSKEIISTSKSEFQDCIKFGIERKKIELIPLSFSPHGNIPEKKLSNRKKILFVGRIVPLKNLEVLLKSIRILKEEIPDIEFIIVGDEIAGRLQGDDGYKQKLMLLVDELKIKDHVRFEGWKTGIELWKIYQESDLFVFASTYENFGLPLLEAASFGIPLISTDVGVAQDIIGKNNGGKIILELDEHKYAKNIKKLLKDEIMYKRCSKHVQKSAQNFLIDTIVDKYEEIFLRVKKDG